MSGQEKIAPTVAIVKSIAVLLHEHSNTMQRYENRVCPWPIAVPWECEISDQEKELPYLTEWSAIKTKKEPRTDILQDPTSPVPAEIPTRDDLLQEQAEDSTCTHNAICKAQDDNVVAEHQANNLVATKNAAIHSPVVRRYSN
jgi:hypothetical protein